MTDAEKKVSTPEKENASKKTANPVKQKSTSSITWRLTLVYFISLAISGGLYLLWENQQKILIKQQFSAHKIDQELANLKTQQREGSLQTEQKFQILQSTQENLHHNLTNLVRNSEHLRNDWLMAEAEYLIQLANHRLLLEKDVTTAIVALKAADARLAEVADPALLNIRKILANDLSALNNVPLIDLAGLSVTLSALSNNIPNLPLRTPDPATHKINQEAKPHSSSDVKSIKDLPAAVWQDIKSLIIIRNHQEPLQPLLAPQQHFFLTQNLGLLLEQARLVLLNGNNQIYQERLKTTAKWINQFFDTEHNVTRNMLASIEELQKFDIGPALPDISSTFKAISKYRTQGQLPTTPVTEVDKKP